MGKKLWETFLVFLYWGTSLDPLQGGSDLSRHATVWLLKHIYFTFYFTLKHIYFTFRCFNVIRKEDQSNKLKRRTSQSRITTQSVLSDLFRRGEGLPVWQRHKSRTTRLLSYTCITWLTTPDRLTMQETYLQLFCSWNLWDWLLTIRQAVLGKKFLQCLLADFHTDNAMSHVRQPAHSREVPSLREALQVGPLPDMYLPRSIYSLGKAWF